MSDPDDARITDFRIADARIADARITRSGSPLLGIEAAAEMETHCAERSADIAAHFGLPARFVARMRGENPAYWVYLEERWMRETFGPLAPLDRAMRQARDDRRAVREGRLAAQREAFAKDLGCLDSVGLTDATFSASPLRLRLTVCLFDFLRFLGGTGLVVCVLWAGVLVVVYLFIGADWLAHHSLLPVLARAARVLMKGL